MRKPEIIIPAIMQNAVKGLNHEMRWQIIEILAVNNKLTYSQLLRKVDCSTFDLHDHLKIMIDAGLVNQLLTRRGEVKYQISSFGVDLITNMLYALWPPFKHQGKCKRKEKKSQ